MKDKLIKEVVKLISGEKVTEESIERTKELMGFQSFSCSTISLKYCKTAFI
jgi:hypothetical protein